MRYPTSETRSYGQAKLHNGEIIKAPSRAALGIAVFRRLEELGELPLNLKAYLANAICEALPSEKAARECRYIDDDAPPEFRATRELRLDDAWRFVRAMRAWVASGGGMVPQEQAEQRARVCAQCPKNVPLAGCSWCSGLLTAGLELLSGRTTAMDDRLQHCEVCGCANRAAVHFPEVTIDRSLEYPEWCWKRCAAPSPDAHVAGEGS